MRLASSIIGKIDNFEGEGVQGWVCMPDVPEKRLWVELLVDDCPLGLAYAENHHPGATPYGDGCYGFWLPLPPALRETAGTVRVRVANTDTFLEPSLFLPENLSAKKNCEPSGAIGSDMGLTVSGWVRDPAEPERILHVSAWLGGKKLAGTTANERLFRPKIADGHGFSLTLPLELADGTPHHVHLQDGKKRPLPGSPVLVCALPQGVAGWFAGQKKMDAPQRGLVSAFLSNYEAWLPKGVRLDDFTSWQACFPVPNATLPKGVSPNDFVLLHSREHGETLHPKALAHLMNALMEHKADLVYADGVVRQDDGTSLPLCRPAWDLAHFLCKDYLGPVLVRSSLIQDTNCSGNTDSTQRTRLILAAHERDGIRHVPHFLSETGAESVAVNAEHLDAVQEWLNERCAGVTVEMVDAGPNRLCCPVPHAPLVSLLIPTRDKASLLQACLKSLDKSTYNNVEILILDNDSHEPETRKLFRAATKQRLCRFPVRVLSWSGPFNYAAINNFGAQEATGELLCLLNNDTEVITPSWLEEMAGLLLTSLDSGVESDIGAVGAKLLWPNALVQHGGVVVGTHQLAAHIGNNWIANEAGYMNMNRLTRQVSAVTAACLLTPRRMYLEMGGLDATRFPVAFNDVDYCLRLRAAGKKILWTPHARLMHHESASRGHDATPMQKARSAMEMQHFRRLWGHYQDPFYNPNLSLNTVLEPFAGLALPPRSRSIR